MTTHLKVLMIEDSENDALLLIRQLRQGGYDPEFRRVHDAESLDDALKGETWQIVICDYQMPTFNGSAALEQFKKYNVDIPFIVVSGVIGEETAVGMMKAGAHDYLLKHNLTRLIPAIERELREAEERRKRRCAEMQRERLLSELQNALAEVKILGGLLPICASCKNIRDDHGYWQRVETYIQDRSKARFTHSICPHCMEKLYPQFAGKIDGQPQPA